MTREVFVYYLQRFLLPVVRPGQVLVLDNYVVHKGTVVRELVREAGCELVFLPSYSPDLNPIEQAFAKIKASLKRAAAVTLETLSVAVRRALDAVSLSDIQGFFRSAGVVEEWL